MKEGHTAILKQLFSIPLNDGKYLVYAPLKKIAFVANSSLINTLVSYCQQTTDLNTSNRNSLAFLDQLNFFEPSSPPKDEYLEKGVQYDAVVLFLTNQCNLRCSYCYASSGDYPKKYMNWDIAKSAIDFVVREVIEHNLPSVTLGFHGGGEPTLNQHILFKSTDYIRQIIDNKNISLHITGAFNGYWSKKVRNYILKNFTEISLSFDGLPIVQNYQRPTVSGKGSSQRLFETLSALDKADFSYGIRMTATKFSVGYLTDSVSYICERFRPRKIQVEPVFTTGRARQNFSGVMEYDSFIEQFIKAFRIARQHNVELFYSGARVDVLTERFCLAVCRALVVTPEGDVTTCFEIFGHEHPLSYRFFIGNYKQGNFAINTDKLNRHLSHTVKNLPGCEKCFCRWHCAGDCVVKINVENDNFQISDRCTVNQELTKFLILEKIRENGGIVWNGNLV